MLLSKSKKKILSLPYYYKNFDNEPKALYLYRINYHSLW